MILPPCPACGAIASLDILFSDLDRKEAMTVILSMPPTIVRLVPAYLGLFRVVPQGVSWRRATDLARSLRDLVTSDCVTINNKPARPITETIWTNAMIQILGQRAKIELPLTSHAYFLSIAWEMADKTATTEEAQRKRFVGSKTPSINDRIDTARTIQMSKLTREMIGLSDGDPRKAELKAQIAILGSQG